VIAMRHERSIEVGGMPIVVRTDSLEFAGILEERYGGFMGGGQEAAFELDVELKTPTGIGADAEASVRFESGRWILERGDFRAEWDPEKRRGWVRQNCAPYAIDAVLRILHSLILARQGGFLMHAASAVRGGRAYFFSGVSGAGKTTISRLAPADAVLLTDEISYVRPEGDGYTAFGTPFAGELGKAGENVRAPLECVYLLAKGPQNRIEALSQAEAARAVLQNILFFAHDAELVGMVFNSAMRFVKQVPVKRLTFVPDERVWGLI
jgi:hypothetical protein